MRSFLPGFIFSGIGSGLAVFLVACTIYKSDDRSNFNESAVAGAPHQLLATIAADVNAERCWLSKRARSEVAVDESRQLATVHERNLVCLFTFVNYSAESRTQVAGYSTRLREI